MALYPLTCFLASVIFLHLPLVTKARLGQSRQAFKVKLRKEHARDTNGTVQDHGRGFFVGALRLGSPQPQELQVVYSTTTGMVSLPSSDCTSAACTEHHSYAPARSETSEDIQADGSRVDPGGGRRALPGQRRDTAKIGFYTTGSENSTGLEGVFVREVVCLGDHVDSPGSRDPACASVALLTATTVQDATFRARPQDGMVGLGLPGQSINPSFNMLKCLSAEGARPKFGFWVSDDAHEAELTFGGHDQDRLAAELEWTPVAAPEKGHWLADIVGIRVGDKPLDICTEDNSCRGLLDTSSPGITVPGDMSKELLELVKVGEGAECKLPNLSFELRGGITLTLTVEDYAGPQCEAEIRVHHMQEDIVGAPLFMLGEPIFRAYYTVFDWGFLNLGFGKVKTPRSCQRLVAAGLPADPATCIGPIDHVRDEIFLMEESHQLLQRRNLEM